MRFFIFSLLMGLMFLNVKSVYASDDYPTGCIIKYNGQARVYTDFKFTDSSSCRHYSLAVDYVIGELPQEVSISYTSPYRGTCTVDGATKGTNVIISSIEKPEAKDNGATTSIIAIIVLSMVLGSFTLRFYFLG